MQCAANNLQKKGGALEIVDLVAPGGCIQSTERTIIMPSTKYLIPLEYLPSAIIYYHRYFVPGTKGYKNVNDKMENLIVFWS